MCRRGDINGARCRRRWAKSTAERRRNSFIGSRRERRRVQHLARDNQARGAAGGGDRLASTRRRVSKALQALLRKLTASVMAVSMAARHRHGGGILSRMPDVVAASASWPNRRDNVDGRETLAGVPRWLHKSIAAAPLERQRHGARRAKISRAVIMKPASSASVHASRRIARIKKQAVAAFLQRDIIAQYSDASWHLILMWRRQRGGDAAVSSLARNRFGMLAAER